ncbi:hypothetical protein [Lishizhenia sp.]|uniref:hypothetical protein n=1 Tax=Lishizhenia sp. TaxID=2497594 RepID=UPI00299D7867|nr:hypothetical protein [Lishizhenia sp.]MDX1445317.1 hypothetical protein [Lishizhenia sp.]
MSFCIAVFYFLYFITELFSPSLADQLSKLQEINTYSENLEAFKTELHSYEKLNFASHILGLLAASLIVISVIRMQLHIPKSYKLYLIAILTCIAYNISQLFLIFNSWNQTTMMNIGGMPNNSVTIYQYVQSLLDSFNLSTHLLFISVALIFLIFNVFFINHGKTKYLFKLYSASEE